MCLLCLDVSREVRDLTRVMWSADGIGLFAICGHYINEEVQLCSNYAHITEQIRGHNGRRHDHFTVTNDDFLETSPTTLMPLSYIARFLTVYVTHVE